MAKQIRVKVFKNAEELLNLAEMVFKKHQELQVDSPLKPLGWDTEGAKVAQAIELHKKAKEYARLAEQAHEQRNALLEPIDTMVKQSRDLLKAIYKKEPRKLGEFGFTVMTRPEPKKQSPKSRRLRDGGSYKYRLAYKHFGSVVGMKSPDQLGYHTQI